MFGINTQRRRGGRDEAEKPFWISFSDLMTALMVLFLVSMAVALMAVTQGIREREKGEGARKKEIAGCMMGIEILANTDEFKGVVVRGQSVEFGTLAEFKHDKDTLDLDQERIIRAFVPKALKVARSKTCDDWLKRVIVEGFASQVGTYLRNLDLSFRRSQRILCVLLDPHAKDALSIEDRKLIRTLFLAGGSSFNTLSKSAAEMRRVELKLEFRALEAKKESPPTIPWDEDAKCPNDLR